MIHHPIIRLIFQRGVHPPRQHRNPGSSNLPHRQKRRNLTSLTTPCKASQYAKNRAVQSVPSQLLIQKMNRQKTRYTAKKHYRAYRLLTNRIDKQLSKEKVMFAQVTQAVVTVVWWKVIRFTGVRHPVVNPALWFLLATILSLLAVLVRAYGLSL